MKLKINKILLKQIGSKNSLNYKLQVFFNSNIPKGFVKDNLGNLSNVKNKKFFFVNTEKLGFWLNNGAIISKSSSKWISKLSFYVAK